VLVDNTAIYSVTQDGFDAANASVESSRNASFAQELSARFCAFGNADGSLIKPADIRNFNHPIKPHRPAKPLRHRATSLINRYHRRPWLRAGSRRSRIRGADSYSRPREV